jgi:hypothetical protein
MLKDVLDFREFNKKKVYFLFHIALQINVCTLLMPGKIYLLFVFVIEGDLKMFHLK